MSVRDDDLTALLLEGASVPEGQYRHALWELRTNGQAVSNAASIVSVHEMLHHLLNNTTAYGLALIVVAHLARRSEDFTTKRNTLVRQCRTAHEVFATYVSLLLVAREYLQSKTIKEIYPGYEHYVHEAQLLLPGVGQYRHQHAIMNGSIRVCFQSPELAARLDEGRPFDISDSPNDRLKALQSIVDEAYWPQRLSVFRDVNQDTPGVDQYLGDQADSVVIENIGAANFDVLSRSLDAFVYQDLSALLPAHGLEVLPEDYHLRYLEQLIAHVRELDAFHDREFPLAIAEHSDDEPPLVQFENEQLIFREQKLPAIVVPFRQILRHNWSSLSTRSGDRRYMYVLSRITERALEAYAFSAESAQWLQERHADFFTAVVARQQTENGLQLVFAVLDTPAQLAELSEAGNGVLGNSSLLLTADSRWESWHEALDRYSSHTMVVDLAPSTQLLRVADFFDSLFYRKLHIESDDGETYGFLLLVGRGAVPTGIYLLACGEVMANLAIDYLTKSVPSARPLDDRLEENKEIFWLAQIAVAHLVEESRFDFRALNTAYATRGFQAGHFRQ
jgi:hypothetical protein